MLRFSEEWIKTDFCSPDSDFLRENLSSKSALVPFRKMLLTSVLVGTGSNYHHPVWSQLRQHKKSGNNIPSRMHVHDFSCVNSAITVGCTRKKRNAWETIICFFWFGRRKVSDTLCIRTVIWQQNFTYLSVQLCIITVFKSLSSGPDAFCVVMDGFAKHLTKRFKERDNPYEIDDDAFDRTPLESFSKMKGIKKIFDAPRPAVRVRP